MQIQDQAITLFKEVLQDRIGECLDRWFPGDALVQLDQIAIDLGCMDIENWEEAFLSRFMAEFELALEAAHSAHGIEAAVQNQAQAVTSVDEGSQSRGPWAALAYFLAQGFLPWWHTERQKSSIQDLVRALIEGPTGMSAGLHAHIRQALGNPLALKRLVQALPDALLAELALAMGTLDEAGGASLGRLTQLLALPTLGISHIAARYAVWEAVLAGKGGRLLPEEVLSEAILSLATAVSASPLDLLQAAASSDPHLSSALLRDIAQVQARLRAHPEQAQARAQEAQLQRAATALQDWLQQADPQQFDLDKALSLLRDLQAALPPGTFQDEVAAAIAQLNSARRAKGKAPLSMPPPSALLRLHEAMRQDAAHCPAQVLLAMQAFYLQLSLLHAPATQDTLLAAPMQQLAIAVMHLNASAGASSQGPYLHASARQLLAALDAQEKSARLPASGDVPDAQAGAITPAPVEAGAITPAPAEAGAIAAGISSFRPEQSPWAQVAPLHAPSAAAVQAQASAFIAAQIAALAHQGLQSPPTINLAEWRAWFKAMCGPALRPLLGQSGWRDLLQAISELLTGQAPALQLRTVAQRAAACQQAIQPHQGPGASLDALRIALQELVELTDETGAPKDFIRAQARLRAIASLLNDTAASRPGTEDAASREDGLPPHAAWQALRASLLALATFGSPALRAAGVSAAHIAALHELISLADADVTPAHAASGTRILLDMRAGLETVAQTTAAQHFPALPSLGAAVSHPNPAIAASERPSEAVLKRITDLLQNLIALSARLELELVARQQPPSAKAGLPDWRRIWETLRLQIDTHEQESAWNMAVQTGMDGIKETSFDPASQVVSSSSSAAALPWQAMEAVLNEPSAKMEFENAVLPSLRRQALQAFLPPMAEPAHSLLLYFSDAHEFHATTWDPVNESHPEETGQVNQRGFSAPETLEIPAPGLPVLQPIAIARRVQLGLSRIPSSDAPAAQGQPSVTAPITIQASNASLHHLAALGSPTLEAAAAELLLGVAHMLAPAWASDTMSNTQIAWWNSASADVVAHMIAALESGQVSLRLAQEWEQLRSSQLTQNLISKTGTWSLEGASVNVSSLSSSEYAYVHSPPWIAAIKREQQVYAPDAAKQGEEMPTLPNPIAWESEPPLVFGGMKENGLDTLQPGGLPESTRMPGKKAEDPAQLAGNAYQRPQFRCLWADARTLPLAAETVSVPDASSPSPHAEHTAAGSTDLPAALQAATQRLRAPYCAPAGPSLAAIQLESLQAHHQYLLQLGSEGVARLLAQPSAQAMAHPPLLRQIQQWMRQFPGQALPSSLAKALASALIVLDLASKTPARMAQEGGQTRPAAVPPSQAAAPALPPASSAAAPAPLAQAIALASTSLPKPSLAASPAILLSEHGRLLRPRPVPILSGRVFQARAEQLLSSVQKLLALPASGKGLRRTLDRLAQQVQPANPIPSLSETGRQQLAEAAAQVKVLLREPLPAHMHAALRALQGKLLGQAQGRPDLKAMQRISTQANTLLTSQLKGKAAPKTPEKELSIYVQNAGLVLLWPFIPRFFQNLGLVEGREFVSPEAHARAVLFLQYLADPDPETAEHLLPLCKLLCGYPDDRPIHLELLPSDEEIAACEGLLATVPGHHPAMKNMRVEGFRTAWLQREGALKPRGDHHLLHVEKQAYDILLEQLPWSIRVIRLPWMHTAILTEW